MPYASATTNTHGNNTRAGYPNEHTAFIGLLEVHGEHRGKGAGAAAYRGVEEYVAREWPEVRMLRLAVVDTNAEEAQGFWERLGFGQTGEVKPYRYDKLESLTRLYEKPLLREQCGG